jgi:hypothetical protein
MARRPRGGMDTQPYWRLGRGSNPFAISRLTDNPYSTARRKARPDGNRTHISRAEPGRSFAVELRESPAHALDLQCEHRVRFVPKAARSCAFGKLMGKWRDRRRHSHAGNRTRTARLSSRRYALVCLEDRSASAHPKCWRTAKMVRKPGFAPGPSPSQGEMLLVTPQSCLDFRFPIYAVALASGPTRKS